MFFDGRNMNSNPAIDLFITIFPHDLQKIKGPRTIHTNKVCKYMKNLYVNAESSCVSLRYIAYAIL